MGGLKTHPHAVRAQVGKWPRTQRSDSVVSKTVCELIFSREGNCFSTAHKSFRKIIMYGITEKSINHFPEQILYRSYFPVYNVIKLEINF